MKPYYILALRVNGDTRVIEGFYTRNVSIHSFYVGRPYDEISKLEKITHKTGADTDDRIHYFAYQFDHPVTYCASRNAFPDIFGLLSNMLSENFSGNVSSRIDVGRSPCYDLGCSFNGDNGYCTLTACIKHGSITVDHTEPDAEYMSANNTSIVCPNCHRTIGYLMKGEE